MLEQPVKLRFLLFSFFCFLLVLSVRLKCSNQALYFMGLLTKDGQMSPPSPRDSLGYTDGRIVTGANLASAHKTAKEAVKAFEKL